MARDVTSNVLQAICWAFITHHSDTRFTNWDYLLNNISYITKYFFSKIFYKKKGYKFNFLKISIRLTMSKPIGSLMQFTLVSSNGNLKRSLKRPWLLAFEHTSLLIVEQIYFETWRDKVVSIFLKFFKTATTYCSGTIHYSQWNLKCIVSILSPNEHFDYELNIESF